MASSSTIEFHTLTLKHPATNQIPSALNDHLTNLKSNPAIHSIHLGQQIEHPARMSLIITGSSPDPAWINALDTLVDSRSSITEPNPRGNPPAALDAPCTEVFTCHGVDDGFLDSNMRPFAEGVEHGRPEGFHGSTYGAFELPGGGDQPKGTAVRILLGWDSKEAHLAQRGEGKGMG